METLYAINKSSTSKCKFSDLPLLALKFTKFLMLFWSQESAFLQTLHFALLFSVKRHNSSVIFHLNLYALVKWIQSKCKFSDFWLLAWILTKFLMSFFKPQVSFPLILQHFSVSWHIIPLKFSNWNIICFGQEEPINVQFFRLLSALKKFTQFLMPFLKPKGQGLFKFYITVQCHER